MYVFQDLLQAEMVGNRLRADFALGFLSTGKRFRRCYRVTSWISHWCNLIFVGIIKRVVNVATTSTLGFDLQILASQFDTGNERNKVGPIELLKETIPVGTYRLNI